MTTQTAITLTTHVAELPAIGPDLAPAFERLDIRCVSDLLTHLPSRHEHELPEQTIAAAQQALGSAHGSRATLALRGEIISSRWVPAGRRPRLEAQLTDGTGTVALVWYNAPWMRNRLHPGVTIAVNGRARRHGDAIQVINAQWRIIDPDEPAMPRQERWRPIYPASEELKSWQIERAIASILEPALALLPDHLHDDYRRGRALPTLADSYRMIHLPRSQQDIDEGQRRLRFDELLQLQLAVMLKRRHRRDQLRAIALKWSPAIDQHIRARFPFALTPSQDSVLREIAGDLQRAEPMNRLLQGDVGSGKTVVALYGMLMAVASGHQAALMAPTELLAEQHYASIVNLLRGGRVSIELLTGSLSPDDRASVLHRLESGAIDLLVGTHALLTESVRFASLALAVIDEQHRFGVHQRASLRAKAADEHSSPHVLVMTATPIPRTLSLTLFGDLDISTIRELPPGRQPIITKLVNRSRAAEVYRYLAKRISGGGGGGEQAYVVVPTIDESDSNLVALRTHMDALQRGPFRGRRLAAVHGRLERDTREAIMHRFRKGEIDALIATTVIEVGVDVPNASLMVIEDADRFGLAQLHQLRGRIGRGSRKSLCVLISDPATEDGAARVKALVSTTDGFAIAEEDLRLRGPGELFGTKQSGAAPLRAAEFPRDMELLNLARHDAKAWIDENPTHSGERDALLRKRLLKAHGKSLGLGDVA
jgi:ATP-dependent DNA helicase RecG